MPKICIIYGSEHERHPIIVRQISAFLEAGFAVSVVDLGQATETPMGAPSRYKHRRASPSDGQAMSDLIWPFVRRLGSRSVSSWFWRRVMWTTVSVEAVRLAGRAAEEKPDWYVSGDLRSTAAALLARKLYDCPTIYSAHEIESEQGAGEAVKIQQAFLRSLERRLIPRVDHLVVPNPARGEWYREHYGLRRQPIVVRNCPPKRAALESDRLRAALDLDSSVRIVLYHGALIPHRALDNLVRSAGLFDDGIILVFVGDQGDYYRDLLRPLAKDEGLEDRVFFLPYVDHREILSYVASADLGVVIYKNVNLNNYLCAPTKLYEYLMMQVPVVACDFPGLADFMERYPVGPTFDPEDPVSIARAVNGHFSARPNQRETVRRALMDARARFNWETESQKWLDLLNGRVAG